MDINEYIESLTKIDKDRNIDDVKWCSITPTENVNLVRNNNLPYHLEIEKDLYEHSNMENLVEAEHQSDYNTTSEWKYQFPEIIANVREIGLGWNVIRVFEKRYRESQQRYVENNLDESISESNYSYTTAKSFITEDSYSTAIEDFEYLRRPSVDINSDISIDSSIDKGRYKKNALITGLLQSAENSLIIEDQVLTDYSTEECDTSNLRNDDINNAKTNENENLCEVKLDDNYDEKNMYEDRVLGIQSKEDEDVYVHPLIEQIQEESFDRTNPECQEYRLSRKGIEYTETARQYYMNIPEDQFEVFEKAEKKEESKTRKKKIKRNRYTFLE